MWLIFALIGMALGASSNIVLGTLVGALLGYLLKEIGDLKRINGGMQRQLDTLRKSVEDAQKPRQPALTPPVVPAQPAAMATPKPSAPRTEQAGTTAEPAPAPRAEPQPMPKLATQYASTSAYKVSPRNKAQPPGLGDWVNRLLAGNLLAKLGIVLLFFGAASGLKLAADHGLFPPEMRLACAALAGLLFIWMGAGPATGGQFRPAWLLRITEMSSRTRAGFGFALEGGGFGLLYLTTYFALSHFYFIGPAFAFVLFACLGVTCVVLALRQEGQALALLGLSGAFLAPLLAGGDGSHLVLFAYIILLDLFILWASLRRGWRSLILAGLFFTILLGVLWADTGYRSELRNDTVTFIVILLAMFSLAPVLAARRGEGGEKGWQSATLLFCPPAVAAMAQSQLFRGEPDTLALCSLLAGLWYAMLWFIARHGTDGRLPRALAGMALAFLSLAPFLAFSQNTASVFWALEGAGLVWYARRGNGVLPMAAGILLQALSGIMLLDLWNTGTHGEPFRNGLFHSSMLLVAAYVFSSIVLKNIALLSRLFLVAALLWWFAAWNSELGNSLNDSRHLVAILLLASITFVACEWGGRRLAMPDLRAASMLLLPLAAIIPAVITIEIGHPLAEGLWLVLPLSLIALYAILRRHEQAHPDWLIAQRHVLQLWAIAWVPAWEAFWLAGQVPGMGSAFPEAARATLLAVPLMLAGNRNQAWPLAPHRRLYESYGLALPALLAWLWLFTLPITLSGDWALPYVPLLNPLELSAALLLLALHRHWRATGCIGRAQGYAVLFPLALLSWLTAILARSVHHWQAVPYQFHDLWQSAVLQALVSVAWTAFALAAMVLASKRHARIAWFGGLALLSVVGAKLLLVDLANVSGLLRVLSLLGIGLLVLGAGYLAPVPPKQDAQEGAE